MVTKNKFLNNISVLVGGVAVAQAITFIATIYLTQIYSPDSFGLLSLCTSIVSLLVPLFTLRLDKAIVLADDEDETQKLFFLTIGVSCFFFLISLIIALLVWFFELLNKESHYVIVFIVPFAVFLFAIMNIFQMYFEKKMQFRTTSFVSIIDAFSKVFFQYFYKTFFPLIGIVLGYISALIINVAYYVFKGKKILNFTLLKFKKRELILVFKKFDTFPKYFTWSNIIDSASQNVCALTFPFLFTLSVLGKFSIAYKIVRLPALLISMATRRSYYPKAVELYKNNKKDYSKFYIRTTLSLLYLSFFPVVLFFLFADDILSFFFNKDWLSSVDYVKIILWYVFVNFCNSLAHENMIIFGLQKQFLIIEIIWFLLSLCLIYITYLIEEPYLAVVSYSISGIIMEVIVFITQYKIGINKIRC